MNSSNNTKKLEFTERKAIIMEDDNKVKNDDKKKKDQSKSDQSCHYIEDRDGNYLAPCGCFPASCCC
jgi:hypothetical protein